MKRATLSASNLGAAALCPAKPRMEAPFAEEETEWSRRGTLLHKYFRTNLDRGDLSEDDRHLLESADRLSEGVEEQFKELVGLGPEERYTSEHEVQMDGPVPGHADTILTWRNGKYACILDLKSGVRPSEEAPDNYQLACYALLQHSRKAFEKCCVAIIQPNAFGPRVTTAIYDAHSMPDVHDSILRIRYNANDDTAQPVAGEYQCRYCRAKAVCPAYREKFEAVAVIGIRAVSTLDNHELVKVHQAIQFANRIRDDVQNELRTRIENGSLPGKLRSTGTTRELVNPEGLWIHLFERYSEHPKFSASRYDACRKLSFGAFEELIQDIEGCTQKRAKEIVRELTGDYVMETPKQPAPIPSECLTPANLSTEGI